MLDIGNILLGTGAGTILATVASAFVNRRKLGADTASVLSKTALELIEPLRERITELQAEVEELREKVRETTTELETCREASRAKDRRIHQKDQQIADLTALRREI